MEIFRRGELYIVQINKKRTDAERNKVISARSEKLERIGEVPRRSSQSADSHQLTPKLWRGLQRKDGRSIIRVTLASLLRRIYSME